MKFKDIILTLYYCPVYTNPTPIDALHTMLVIIMWMFTIVGALWGFVISPNWLKLTLGIIATLLFLFACCMDEPDSSNGG